MSVNDAKRSRLKAARERVAWAVVCGLCVLWAEAQSVTEVQREFLGRDAASRRSSFADAAYRRQLALPPADPPLCSVPESSAEAPCILFDPTVPNVRDLGGWPVKDGARIRRGRLFRSAGLNENARRIKRQDGAPNPADGDRALRQFARRTAAQAQAFRASVDPVRKTVGIVPPSVWRVKRLSENLLPDDAARLLAEGVSASPARGEIVEGACLGEGGEGRWCVMEGVLTADADGWALIDCRGDWYWALTVNGLLVRDRLEGNCEDSGNRICLKVKRGENLLRVIVGSGTDAFAFRCQAVLREAVDDELLAAEGREREALATGLVRHTCGTIVGASRITPQNRDFWLKTLGVRTDLDLRSDRECRGMSGSPLGPTVAWRHISFAAYEGLQTPVGRKAVAQAFRLFLDETNYPILMHCISGQDRTGSLAFVLEALLGVSEEDLARDWEVSAFCNSNAEKFVHCRCYDRLVAGFREHHPATSLRESVEQYVLSLGFTPEDLAHFRAMNLERGIEGK